MLLLLFRVEILLRLSPRPKLALAAIFFLKQFLELFSPNCICAWSRAIDDFSALQVRSVKGTRRIRVESWSGVVT